MDLKSLVKRKLDNLMEGHKSNILGGAAKDMAEYAKMAGFIEGVTKAYAEIESLLGDDADTET